MNAAARATARRSAVRLIVHGAMLYVVVAILMAASASAGVVPTDKGPVRGVESQTVKQYLGIPYAAPPVGDLRWQPPRPVARWHGPRDAAHYASHCPQPESPFGRQTTTEDCLYLNVFTPSKGGKGHAKDLPVMFWMHGGGLSVGESDDYDPTRLVEQGVVIVTVNYRLGELGFLAHEALANPSDQSAGNYGLMDQQAALRWVRRNITKFGGDAGNVTIFGESAGGLSVHSQLASPLAAGLFHRAIAQSGAYALRQTTLAQAKAAGTAFASRVGCSDQTAVCLRALSVDQILAGQGETTLPNLDGRILPQSIGAALANGQFNRVPVLEGTTRDEFSIFAALNIEFVFGRLTPALYPIIAGAVIGALSLDTTLAALLAEYPITDYPSAGLAITAFATDALFACPGRQAAQSLSQYVPTFAFEFADRNAPQRWVRPASFPYGAYHGSELQYLFDLPTVVAAPPLDGDQQQLADSMVLYWTQFARSGNPTTPRTPVWPAYTTATDQYQSLEPPLPVTQTTFAADHHCDFWTAP